MKRTDSNQHVIVSSLRTLGWSVADTHALGHGFPDLVVSRRGEVWLIEVKDGSLPSSRRRLTPDERRWATAWRAPGRHVVLGCAWCCTFLGRGGELTVKCASCGVAGPVPAVEYKP